MKCGYEKTNKIALWVLPLFTSLQQLLVFVTADLRRYSFFLLKDADQVARTSTKKNIQVGCFQDESVKIQTWDLSTPAVRLGDDK